MPTPVVSAAPSGKQGGSLTVLGYASIPHRDVHQEFQETLTTLGPGLAYSRLLRLRTGPLVEQSVRISPLAPARISRLVQSPAWPSER